jgi:hypothetical protein
MNRLHIATRSIRRESAHGYRYALAWFAQRFLLRFVRRHRDGLPAATPADDARPITVVIPAVDKDADVLEPCLRSVREFVRNRIEALWVVAPESPRLRALAEAAQATLVPEDTLLPRPARELKTRGWVLQQLIKLNACHRVPTADYLVLDADTVFLRPQSFVRGGRAVLRYSDQYELLYNRSLQLVFGHGRRFPVSFVTHHQLFQVAAVKALLALLEQRFGRPWWEAILHEMDQGHLISFSEYELYGHFVVGQPGWRKSVALQYWHGLDRDQSDLPGLAELRRTAGPRCNSVSYHAHTQ